MSDALLPRLTTLDEQVLALVPTEGAVREGHVITAMMGRSGCEVREVLNGLEAVGLVVCGRGGWWRRTMTSRERVKDALPALDTPRLVQ
jgi:hypothetical protein